MRKFLHWLRSWFTPWLFPLKPAAKFPFEEALPVPPMAERTKPKVARKRKRTGHLKTGNRRGR